MKTTAYVKWLVPLLLLGACDRTTRQEFGGEPAGMHSIAYLKSLCTKACVPVTRDLTIRGTVTANDRFGEFYKTLVIEDASGGISLAADRTELFLDYPVGTTLTVSCNGLMLCDYGGKIQLGTEPRDDTGAGRIPSAELARYLHPETATPQQPVPATLTIDALAARHTDTFVRLDGVRFLENGSWCDTDPETGRAVTTERTITDARGNRLTIRTAGTCAYAKEPVPEGTGSLCGIIDCFGGRYSLRIANRSVVFTAPEAPPTAYP